MKNITGKVKNKTVKSAVTCLGNRLLILGVVSVFAIVSAPVIAGPHDGGAEHGAGKAAAAKHGGGSMHGAMHGGGAMHGAKHGGKHKKKQKSGTFTPHWVKTLSDEQKLSFDKMHLAVGQYEAVHRAKLKMLEAELNVLVAKEMNNKSFIYAKIDEILDVKKGLMRNRYDHISEMRAELTEQQRISYDMGLLKRGKHKH